MDRTNDRISEYLVPHLKEYLFDELSDSYLERAGIMDIMKGVSVPVNVNDLENLTVLKIAKNMAFVMGCDPSFEFVDNYVKYILRNFDIRFSDALVTEGLEVLKQNDYDYACILFRAAIIINPDNASAYYMYGRACKYSYEQGEEEEYIGRYKAEALEAFEVATIKNPKMAEAYYFLGYAYLNMGLYVKTKLTWEQYVKLITDSNLDVSETEKVENEMALKDIKELLEKIDEPCKIEEGYNLVISSKYEEGIKVLEKYKNGPYANWWPLWYYLGVAYMSIGEDHENEIKEIDEIAKTAYYEAINNFNEALKFSPSNDEVMKELVKLYEKVGDIEKKEKYEKKIGVVENNKLLDKKLAKENLEKLKANDKLN